jgi:ribosomal-protein-alanine N-acetyltransferase
MAPVLSGPGLVVRPWEAADAEALEPACGDPDIGRYTTVPETFSPEAAQAWIARQQNHEREGTALVLAIEPADAHSAVGMVGLFLLGRDDGPRLGYWLMREHRSRGLATVAAGLLVDWALTHDSLDRVFVDVERGNVRSLRLAERLGAEFVERRIEHLHDGRTVDLDRFAIRHRPG